MVIFPDVILFSVSVLQCVSAGWTELYIEPRENELLAVFTQQPVQAGSNQQLHDDLFRIQEDVDSLDGSLIKQVLQADENNCCSPDCCVNLVLLSV